jgi:glycosyltransferase involved in cell wall biosynthesis
MTHKRNDLIKVFINALAVKTGGTETFLINLLPILTSLSRHISYTLVVRKTRKNLYENLSNNVDIISIQDNLISTIIGRLVYEHVRTPLLFVKGKYDLFFQVDEMLSPVIGFMNICSLSVFHTTPLALNRTISGNGLLYTAYNRFVRNCTVRYTTVPVTVSCHAKAEFSNLYPSAHQRFQVIHHGVNLSHYYPDRSSFNPLTRYGVSDHYILSISNRFTWKNYYRLIQAYHRLCEQEKLDNQLVLIGIAKNQNEERRIASYIQENNLEDKVVIVNYIKQADLPGVYRSASAYIFPSLLETFGLTVLEAMACGVPIACARCGPLPEVCGDAAHYFDPLDIEDMKKALKIILMNKSRRKELIEMGLKHAAQYSWVNAARNYHRLILEALGK